MKILLCCKAGVTSNMFASALKDEAAKKDLEIIIWAAAETAVEYSIEQGFGNKACKHKVEKTIGKECSITMELHNLPEECDLRCSHMFKA